MSRKASKLRGRPIVVDGTWYFESPAVNAGLITD